MVYVYCINWSALVINEDICESNYIDYVSIAWIGDWKNAVIRMKKK